jgi:hypothetical protein
MLLFRGFLKNNKLLFKPILKLIIVLLMILILADVLFAKKVMAYTKEAVYQTLLMYHIAKNIVHNLCKCAQYVKMDTFQ